jgi:Protein of unknown function (DUF3568)
MRKIIFGTFIAAVLAGVGCVKTVNDRTTAGMPFLKDKIQARYERSVDQVTQATKDVITNLGTLVNEATMYNHTNAVRTVEGKVNQRSVWVRVEGIDRTITEVTVQARTSGGGSDVDLAAQIDKEIALKLASR